MPVNNCFMVSLTVRGREGEGVLCFMEGSVWDEQDIMDSDR